jgi:hypothetical protein
MLGTFYEASFRNSFPSKKLLFRVSHTSHKNNAKEYYELCNVMQMNFSLDCNFFSFKHFLWLLSCSDNVKEMLQIVTWRDDQGI